MLIVDVNDQRSVANHVAALGVAPAANYLVMYKRAPGWLAVVGALNSRDPSTLDEQMAANEEMYLLVFVDGNLLVQNLEKRADNAPRELPGTELSDVGSDELEDQMLLHFVRGKKRQNYYMFKNSRIPRYQTDNWAHLLSTHFENLGTSGQMSQRTVRRSVPRMRPDVAASGSRIAARKEDNQSGKQPLPVVSGEDIPSAARPEREYHGLFGSGRAHKNRVRRASREETYHVNVQTGERKVSWLRRRLSKTPAWRLVLYILVILFLGVTYTLENIGSHVVTGTVIGKRIETHTRSGDDRYVRLRLANGQKIEIENNDTVFHNKFNAEELQAKIHKGLRYRFETVGIANNDWLSYNIVKMKLLK